MIRHPRGNPREVYREYLDYLPEERFQAWEQRAECLCGCGTKTSEIAHGRGGYKGMYSFWYGHHFHHWRRINQVPVCKDGVKNRPPSWAMNTARAQRKLMNEYYVDPTVIGSMVREHLEQNKIPFSPWAREHGFAVEHIRRVVSGKGPKRIHPKTAVALLRAIGEEPHPDLLKKRPQSRAA